MTYECDCEVFFRQGHNQPCKCLPTVDQDDSMVHSVADSPEESRFGI